MISSQSLSGQNRQQRGRRLFGQFTNWCGPLRLRSPTDIDQRDAVRLNRQRDPAVLLAETPATATTANPAIATAITRLTCDFPTSRAAMRPLPFRSGPRASEKLYSERADTPIEGNGRFSAV